MTEGSADKPDRLARLRQEREQINAQIAKLEARRRHQERKDDTRRKVLAGAAVLDEAKRDTAFADALHRLLGRFLSKSQDRALFGLPPVPGSGSAAGSFRQAAARDGSAEQTTEQARP